MRYALLTLAAVYLSCVWLDATDYTKLPDVLGARGLVDVSGAIAKTRMLKDPDELETMSKAAEIVSSVVDTVPDIAEEGMTERALKADIDYSMVEAGADSPSFESIVAFGENSALPQPPTTSRHTSRLSLERSV